MWKHKAKYHVLCPIKASYLTQKILTFSSKVIQDATYKRGIAGSNICQLFKFSWYIAIIIDDLWSKKEIGLTGFFSNRPVCGNKSSSGVESNRSLSSSIFVFARSSSPLWKCPIIRSYKQISITYITLGRHRIISAMRPKSRSGREIFLYTTIDAGRKMQFNVKPLIGKGIFCRILVQHDHNLWHVIQFRNNWDIFHGTSPLFIRCNIAQWSVS